MSRTKENYREIYKKYHSDVDISGLHIHHLDGDSNNNDISNLIALTQEDHYKIHFFQRDFGAAALLSAGIDAEAPTRVVRQYDLDGYFLKEYRSVSDAGLETGFDTGNIAGCCRYRDKSCSGYQWFYYDEVGDIDYIGPIKRKQQSGGNKTNTKYFMTFDGNVFKGQRSLGKYLNLPLQGGIPDGFNKALEITKEEYKILKQLENE